jgi:hypothetical protein
MRIGILAATTLLVAIFVLSTFAIAPVSHAYGKDQWQIGFSGNFHVVGSSINAGFWGWCAFGGSSGSSAIGTTGTTGDCEQASYFGKTVGALNSPFHASFDGPWVISTGSRNCLSSSTPCFFFTAGTVEVTGPGAASLGVPTGVELPLASICGSPPAPGSPCDTGLPAIPGHFSLSGTFPGPGGSTISTNVQIQVTQLP